MEIERHDEIIRLREAGLSYAEIGRRFGVGRERVRQIVRGMPARGREPLESKAMLTTGEVAYLLGLNINTVRRWSDQGILRAHRIGPRGDRRFPREDFDRFLEGRQIRAVKTKERAKLWR